MRDLVGLEQAAAEFAQHCGHRGFPGGDSPGEAGAQHQGLAARGAGGGVSVRPAQARGLHGVAHQHGDGQRTDAARHGSDRAGDFDDVGVNVAHQHRAFLAELRELCGEIGEDALALHRRR